MRDLELLKKMLFAANRFFPVLLFTNLQYVQFVESQTSLVSPRQLWDGQQMETFSDYDVWITESAKLDTEVCNQKSEISSFFLQIKYTLTPARGKKKKNSLNWFAGLLGLPTKLDY